MLQVGILLFWESFHLTVKNLGFRTKLLYIEEKFVCFDENLAYLRV